MPALSYPLSGMRCPSCGTENAPDSRFCGGCGARTAPSTVAPTQKISDDAPMPQQPAGYGGGYSVPPSNYSIPPQNSGPAALPPPPSIPPTNNAYGSGPGSIPPTNNPYGNRPGSIPPTNVGPGSIPPTNVGTGSQPPHLRPGTESQGPGTVQRRASVPPVTGPTPSLSLPKKQGGGTRWGVVIFVLLLDLGLAATGAYLLQAGLAEGATSTPTASVTSSSGTPSP